MIHAEPGRAGRARRWLDVPRSEAFWLSVDQIPVPHDAAVWPVWLAPMSGSDPMDLARSGGRVAARSTRRRRSGPTSSSDDPGLPSKFPASTGA